jgi:hypothetical protein
VRYQDKVLRIYFRADAAFAIPGVYEYLEAERIKYAIRIPTNQVLQDRIGYLLKRPVGRPPNEVRRYYANFSYQAGSWTKPRRVIAKVEWHPGELYPRVGFIVTNMSRPAERVVVFYNKRGTCEQWIKEGKGAINWTRLSCRTFAANAVRSRQPRPLCRIPNGRGRHPATNVPGDFAADRRTTAAAACANMRCRWLCAQEQPIGGVRPNARENGQISPAGAVRAVRDDGTRPRRHPLARTRENRKNARKIGSHPGNPGLSQDC